MNKLTALPDIVFVDASIDEIESAVIGGYEDITGRTLAKGDPVRLFLLTIADVVLQLKNNINETGKQNLLRYAAGPVLDHIGALVGCERIEAKPAVTTMQITLSEARPVSVTIPAGTRFTAGDDIYFRLDEPMVILAGAVDGEGQATCTEAGTIGNDYAIGQIKTLVDPVAYVDTVRNKTKSEGGAEVESDDDYRQDIHEAPESFSVAGPTGAYKYWTLRASQLISDASVTSPVPGTVKIIPLMQGGVIPEQEMLDKVRETVNDSSIRPLTDLVLVEAPTAVNYNVELTYYIDSEDRAVTNAVQEAVAAAVEEYKAWQKVKLGRDINPSKLISLVMGAGAKRVVVTSPTFTELNESQVALPLETSINYGGLEDD